MLCASIDHIHKLCKLLFIFSFWLRSKKRKWTKKEKHAKDFCAAFGIALTKWTYVLFALLTKSFWFCYRAYAHAKLLFVTHVSESGERARSAIVSLERIWAESSNDILALSVSEMQGTFACFLFFRLFLFFCLATKRKEIDNKEINNAFRTAKRYSVVPQALTWVM